MPNEKSPKLPEIGMLGPSAVSDYPTKEHVYALCLQRKVDLLKAALRDAILCRGRVISECVDFDPAGSTYEVDWAPEVKEWAKLADLDLDKHDPGDWRR